ncbi:hypothetical protein T4D_12784 [Trichinella pseudospiralis]|uniref:Uncharacterized protein n=1 Tax=Trichinella pseudospiralis TaxID=6337 RepID=A0A0V1DK41_TRIPS|nr:hypothetical protein T4D_12784 [Trichinella pseudospiralis]
MNRNTHGEERRQVEKEMTSERIGWIESFVGQLRSLVSEDTLDGEDAICPSRV